MIWTSVFEDGPGGGNPCPVIFEVVLLTRVSRLAANPVAVPGADAAARQFPRRAGYDEDPATGVAAGALGAYLSKRLDRTRFAIVQGRAMGRPSRIAVEVDNGIWVGGRMRETG